jgi:hypothetical protein
MVNTHERLRAAVAAVGGIPSVMTEPATPDVPADE